jgi:hypothetical protein
MWGAMTSNSNINSWTNIFHKAPNLKPYQAPTDDKKNCTYIKGLMGNMRSNDILLVVIMEQTHFIKPQTLNPIKP